MDYSEQSPQSTASAVDYNEYADVQLFLAECALAHFETILAQPDQVLSPMELKAAAPAYIRATQAIQHHLELQLAANQFPDGELEQVSVEIQRAGKCGRPGLLQKEYHLAERIPRQKLELDLYYLEAVNLRLRGCTQEANHRLDRRLQELQLKVMQYRPSEESDQQRVAEPDASESTFLFADLVALYLGNLRGPGAKKISDLTLERYRSQLTLASQLLDEQKVASLQPQHIERLLSRIDNLPRQYKKISCPNALLAFVENPRPGHPLLGERTRKIYQNRVRQLFNFALDEGLVEAQLLPWH